MRQISWRIERVPSKDEKVSSYVNA
jgi:hypothetical protein